MQVFSVFISTDDSSIRVKKKWQIQVKANRLGNVSLSTQLFREKTYTFKG